MPAFLLSASRLARKRQDAGTGDDGSSQNTKMMISGIVIAVVIVISAVVGFFAFRARRRRVERHKRLASTDDSSSQMASSRPTTQATELSEAERAGSTTENSANLSHRMSVRSVQSIISLPPYKEMPGETEEVVARAGDREGLDFIIEGPETAEEIESRRQEEMSAIYRVQQTRRRELEERAERRRARRAALDRQDYREVARLDRAAALARQRERNNSSTSLVQDVEAQAPSSGDLLAELQEIRSRGRRVSSVSYADLGTARHDGTRLREGLARQGPNRLRATSVDSDSQPLLDSAASLSGQDPADRARARSRASSIGSDSARANSGESARQRSRSRASRNGVEDQESLSHSLSEEGIPPHPPSYDDDASVHAGNVPRYEDIVVTPPSRPSLSHQANSYGLGDVEQHDPSTPAALNEQDPLVSHVANGSANGIKPRPTQQPGLTLQTSNDSMPPSIEVHAATPIGSRPDSPSLSRD